jgi:hypothetical protein
MNLTAAKYALLCIGCLFALGAQAGGQVDVTFQDAQAFTDTRSTWLRQQTLLDGLAGHLKLLAQNHLADHQLLHIRITDVDLAGEIEYTHRIPEIRVLRDITSPHIELRYQLQSADQVQAESEVSLRDFSYLARSNRYSEGDPLRYEKQMLDEWFLRTFGAKKQ